MIELAVARTRAREAEAEAVTEPGLGQLRARLASAGAAAREQVMVDFLEDDLRAAEEALGEIGAYVEAIGAALRGGAVSRGELLALARGEAPVARLDELQGTVAELRRRLALVSIRLPG